MKRHLLLITLVVILALLAAAGHGYVLGYRDAQREQNYATPRTHS